MASKPLDRRTFLRAAGVCVGLPLLDAMIPAGIGQEQRAAAARPRRMVLIGRPLGLHTPFLFPERAGRNYEHTRYTRRARALHALWLASSRKQRSPSRRSGPW